MSQLPPEMQKAIDEITKRLVDEGKIIEAGFAAYLTVTWGHDAATRMNNQQLVALHEAYFSGAQHLWASIMNVMEPGLEPSEKDLQRMDKIATEMDAFYEEQKKRHRLT